MVRVGAVAAADDDADDDDDDDVVRLAEEDGRRRQTNLKLVSNDASQQSTPSVHLIEF